MKSLACENRCLFLQLAGKSNWVRPRSTFNIILEGEESPALDKSCCVCVLPSSLAFLLHFFSVAVPDVKGGITMALKRNDAFL